MPTPSPSAHPIDNFWSALIGHQGSSLARLGDAFVAQISRQANMFDKLACEVDPIQAAAAKELGKAGLSTDLASIRPPALPAVA